MAQALIFDDSHSPRVGRLLEAFIERIKQEAKKPLLPIIDDPSLSAIEQLQGFFETLARLRKGDKKSCIHDHFALGQSFWPQVQRTR